MIKIAIQSKGRLNEDTTRLLADAGIIVGAGHRQLISRAKGFDMEALYLRDDDIPQAVGMHVADIGIVGLNEVEERGLPLRTVMRLGFGACRLSLAVPQATPASDGSTDAVSQHPTPAFSRASSSQKGSGPRSTR